MLKKVIKVDSNRLDEITKYIFENVLLQYQRDWISDKSRFKVYTKSRQIGISEAVTFEALLDVLYNKQNIYFISAGQAQASALLSRFYNWIDLYSDLGIGLEVKPKNVLYCKINGCEVRSFGSNSITSQGFSGTVILDEFALYPDDEKFYSDLYPTISLSGKLRIVSRLFGTNNLFYKIQTGESELYSGYSPHRTTVYDAIKAGLNVDVDDLKKNLETEEWDEQFGCIAQDETYSYLPTSLLRTCIGEVNTEVNGENFVTIDVGRSNDRTAICGFVKDKEEVFNLKRVQMLDKMRFEKQKEVMIDFIDEVEADKVLIDKGLFGLPITESLEDRYGRKVIGVAMNDDMKARGFSYIKKLFENKKILIPNNNDVIDHLRSIQKKLEGGKAKFTAKRNSKGHADIAFSMCLLGELFGDKKAPFAVYVNGKKY